MMYLQCGTEEIEGLGRWKYFQCDVADLVSACAM